MVTIRRFKDLSLEEASVALQRIQEILRAALPGVDASEIEKLPARVLGTKSSSFESHLFLAEEAIGVYAGFALLLHEPVIGFCYLDYIATDATIRSQGVGAMLYETVRSEAKTLAPRGLFFECSPDEIAEVSDPAYLEENAARLRFYERWGARPIVNNEYQLPITPGQKDLPYLVYDSLGNDDLPRRQDIRAIVRAILVGKYRRICTPEYADRVVESFRDPVIQLRPYRYRDLAEGGISPPIVANE